MMAVVINLTVISTTNAQVGTAYKLSNDLVGDQSISNVQFSPDGLYVVYQVEDRTLGETDIFSVSLSSGRTIKLSEGLEAESFSGIEISPDSQYVIYQARRTNIPTQGLALSVENTELYSNKIDSNNPVQLNIQINENDNVSSFLISPDSTNIIYVNRSRSIINPLPVQLQRLYSVSIHGGNSTLLHADKEFNPVGFVNNGSLLVYRAGDRLFELGTTVPGDFNLFTVPVNGGNPRRLNNTNSTINSVEENVQLSPDGRKAVFPIKSDNNRELYSVGFNGFNETLLARVSSLFNYDIAPDSGSVVYIAREITADPAPVNLYSVPIGGGNADRLFLGSDATGDVRDFVFLGDGHDIVLHTSGNATINGQVRSFGALFKYDSSQNLSLLTPVGIQILDYQTLNDDFVVVSYSPLRDLSNRQLYFIDTANADNTQVTSVSEAISFTVSPDQERVAFTAIPNGENAEQIFSLNVNSGDLTQLSSASGNASTHYGIQVNSTGSHLIYQDTSTEPFEIFAHQLKALPEQMDDFCFPIVAQNGKVAVVCL